MLPPTAWILIDLCKRPLESFIRDPKEGPGRGEKEKEKKHEKKKREDPLFHNPSKPGAGQVFPLIPLSPHGPHVAHGLMAPSGVFLSCINQQPLLQECPGFCPHTLQSMHPFA